MPLQSRAIRPSHKFRSMASQQGFAQPPYSMAPTIPQRMSHPTVRPALGTNVGTNSAVQDQAGSDSTTYCMGYWVLAENAKRPVDHYIALIPKTVEMLAGQRLV